MRKRTHAQVVAADTLLHGGAYLVRVRVGVGVRVRVGVGVGVRVRADDVPSRGLAKRHK